jgi:SAM-dependent methyltransferase
MEPSSKRQRVGSEVASAAEPVVLVRPTPDGSTTTGRSQTRSIEDLRWHFPMLNDRERNAKYCAAIEKAVGATGARLRAQGEARGVRVLDIGAGSGLLALAAARAGAEHVTACEVDPLVCGAAAEVVAASGYANIITLLSVHSSLLRVSDLRAGQPVDIVTHELLDSTLLGEDVLPTLRDVYERGLALSGALSVPHGATITAQLVESTSLWARRHPPRSLWCATESASPLSRIPPFARVAANCPAGRVAQGVEASAWLDPEVADQNAETSSRPIGQPRGCDLAIEFSCPPPVAGTRRDVVFELPHGTTGTVHGVVYWWSLDLLPPADEASLPHETIASSRTNPRELTVISTKPGAEWKPREHWWQACCVLPAAIKTAGATELRLTCTQNDTTIWFDGTDIDASSTSGSTEQPAVAAGQWRCVCPTRLHAEWSSQRMQQLADPFRCARYRDALRLVLKHALTDQTGADEVVLAFGTWIGLQAQRALAETYASLGLEGPSRNRLEVVVVEGSNSVRKLYVTLHGNFQRFLSAPRSLIRYCVCVGQLIFSPGNTHRHLLALCHYAT